jgi:alpha-tubulin suppressor-like RCC1 family protein
MKTLLLKDRGGLITAIAWLLFQTVPLHAAINLVSYWRLGEADPGASARVTATNATDSLGANNLKVHGNASYTNDVAPAAATKTGSSLSVNFTNSAYATNAIVSTNRDNFGIECWVKPTALGGGQVIAYNGVTGGAGSGGWGLIIAADNTYEGLFGGVEAFGTNVAVANTWTHLALVRASGISTLYINGVASATNSTAPGLPIGNFALATPPQSPGGSQPFNGLMDEVRVFTFAPGQFSTNDLLLNQSLAPAVITSAPTLVTTNTATLNGTVNPHGLPTIALFQWGPIQFPYRYATAVTNLGSGVATLSVTQSLSGLMPGVTYHYRLVANNAMGTVRGQDLQFWAPVLTVNGNNPSSIKHQTWVDSSGATVRAAPSAVAAGVGHSLALKAEGTIAVWGDNSHGQLNTPPSATNVVAIAAGDYHSLALKADGTVLAWGDNSHGQINIPATATNIIAISARGYNSLAVKADGTVLGWGDNTYGQNNIPGSATNVVAVAAGSRHNLALKGDGTVVGWGNNSFAQITVTFGPANVVAIAAGDYHTLLLKADGTVLSSGLNTFGQATVPASAVNIVAIAGGGNHSLALKADGTIIPWGYNGLGQTNIPPNATNVFAIAAGFGHSLALEADGTVLGWGANTTGQINIPAGLDIPNLSVASTDNVNTNVPGSYQVNYFVTNTYGIVATASRSVLVIDSPTITSPSASLLATNAADALRTVRFTATVNPNGSPTIVSIPYGLTAGYGAVSSTNILPGVFAPQTTSIDVPLSPGFTFHWRVAATNGVDTIPGSAFSTDQIFSVPAAFRLGDANGDGVVDQSELDAVYANYLPTSPWLLMTNVVGLGETNVTFALSNSLSGGYSVEVSTNLTDWQFLGTATPRYLFTDPNSPAAPQRHYRLRYP